MHKKNIPSGNNETEIGALLESLPDAFFIIDAEGMILHANTLFAAQFDRSPQECIGENISDLLSDVVSFPELATHFMQKATEVFHTGERLTFEDERNSFRVAINPFRSKEKTVTKLLISLENISRQKQVEEELEKERALKTALLEAMPGCAIILNADGKLMVWNQYAHDIIFGKTDDITQSVDPIETICADQIFPVKKKFLNILHSGAEDSSEVKICPPGSPGPLWLATRGRRVIIDGEPCVVAVGVDISRQKQLEEDLVESKMRFNYALDAAHSGIWEWDIETDRLSWSEQVWGLYGLQVDSVPLNHQLCVDTIHPEDREMAAWIIKEAVKNQNPASVEYRVRHTDGSIHWLTSRSMPLHSEEGKLIRYIGTIIDITERKQIELELLESKSRLNQALEAARAGVWEWDLQTNENIWSDEIWALYGLQKNEGKPSFQLWANTIHPEDREMATNSVTEAAEHCNEINIQYRVTHSDGATHWLMSRGKPGCDVNGKIIRYLGMAIDITESKQIEMALSQSKTRLNQALEATNAGIWEWNVKSDQVSWSDRVWLLYGMEQDSMKSSHKLCETNVHPEDRDVTFQTVMHAALNETEINVEYRVSHKDGSTHWLMCRGMPLREKDEEVSCYIGTVIDITERKNTDLALTESESKFRSIFDHAPVAIGIWDLQDGRLVNVNVAWLQLFGFTRQDAIEHPVTDHSLYVDLDEWKQIVTVLKNHGRLFNRPVQLRKKNGEQLNVLYSAEFINLKDRSILLVMMTDVTLQELQQQSINQLEKAVAERTGQLQLEIERLERFISMVSHEYRTPLAIIRGNLDLIEVKNQSGNRLIKTEINKIHRAIDRLVEVMEVSMRESRMIETRGTLETNHIAIAPLIYSQIASFKNMWPDLDIRFSERLDDCKVFGEPSQLKLAIYNLVDNARKYSAPDTPIAVNCHKESDEVIITIRNRGTSISREECETLFNKYQRGRNSMNTSGAGLGLWLVKKIIEQHNGNVTLRGFPSGVEATVRLPVADDADRNMLDSNEQETIDQPLDITG
ncbi:MAG: PAS domain S-box protein [Chlorobium sp.]|uniref:PAS domain-containing sensor histidine kinase n=1 Tax=Chlorobium sp. TaxID=1095 RepID=UPI0025C0C19A|nr:PAS domain S-box protein [Chlorobium sp.]MCF8383133.1 PAS domain S-box protein [Chlorobium sp.]